MTSASAGKSIHKPQAKRSPMFSRRTEAAPTEIPARGSGTLVVEADELEEMYSAVLCCTFETETK